MSLQELIPEGWRARLRVEFGKKYWSKLEDYLAEEMATQTVYPPKNEIFRAFESCSYEAVKVLLLGQDPYHGEGEAHGLSFSVRPGMSTPRSLKNVYKELEADLGCEIPNNGYLGPWVDQGVLLLNAVLTVRAGTAASHRNRGWETFSDAVVRALNERERPVIFLLWGGFAKKKCRFVTHEQHFVVESGHPSPLAVRTGDFFGSRPFSKINKFLASLGELEIDWQIPNIPGC